MIADLDDANFGHVRAENNEAMVSPMDVAGPAGARVGPAPGAAERRGAWPPSCAPCLSTARCYCSARRARAPSHAVAARACAMRRCRRSRRRRPTSPTRRPSCRGAAGGGGPAEGGSSMRTRGESRGVSSRIRWRPALRGPARRARTSGTTACARRAQRRGGEGRGPAAPPELADLARRSLGARAAGGGRAHEPAKNEFRVDHRDDNVVWLLGGLLKGSYPVTPVGAGAAPTPSSAAPLRRRRRASRASRRWTRRCRRGRCVDAVGSAERDAVRPLRDVRQPPPAHQRAAAAALPTA